jgi:hypothetical protein
MVTDVKLNPGGVVKKTLVILTVFVLIGCQRGKIPDSGDGALDTPALPPPKDDNRAACPQGTEMKGGPDQSEEWCQKPDGTLHGRFTIWHKNRYKAAEGEYRENLKHGEWIYWHPNGQKASSGGYQQGKRHGEWTYWHENGKLAETGGYLNGLEDGTWTAYDENGEKTSETQHRNGLQVRK